MIEHDESREFWISKSYSEDIICDSFPENERESGTWTHVREVRPGEITLTYREAVEIFADMDCSLESSLKTLSKLFGPLPEGER